MALLFDSNMKKYIEKEQAIETLRKIQKKRQDCNCGRSAIYEATALGYAIAVLSKLPTYEERDILRNEEVEAKERKDT